jgi:hypothetical protein
MVMVLEGGLPKNNVILYVFRGETRSIERVFIKKCFVFMTGSVCHVKGFTTGSRNSLKDVRKSQMTPNQVRKWLRQQSEDFYTAGFHALVKRWDKCINVNGGYDEK